MIKGIFFDLGLTLVYSPREEEFMILCAEEGVVLSGEEVARAYFQTDKYFMKYHPGVLALEPEKFYPWYLQVLFDKLALGLDQDVFIKKLFSRYPPRAKWLPYPETKPVLEELTKQGLRLGLITNWNHTARQVLAKAGLDSYLEPVIVSSEVGLKKPDATIFSLALEKSCLTPGEVIYVGDNYYDDVVGSRRSGIEGVLINRQPEYTGETYDCITVNNLWGVLQLVNPKVKRSQSDLVS